MAINYTISYTFSPNTTIASAQVNQNFSDNANTWTGLEAETKSFAKLKVDASPTSTNEVVIKSYVDTIFSYRRPVLQYNSGTIVNIETGTDGTSGELRIIFPDGNVRTDSTTARIQCNLAQVAALSGSWQSGLQTGTVADNTWYAVYAVKTTDDPTKIVAVATTSDPTQTNFSTLNSIFGTNGWVYLGLVRNGDNSGTASGILLFSQHGNVTMFRNSAVGNVENMNGIRLATNTSAGSTPWAYSVGTGAAQVPANVRLGFVGATCNATSSNTRLENDSAGAGNHKIWVISGQAGNFGVGNLLTSLEDGLTVAVAVGSTFGQDLFLNGFVDVALGIGSNPLV